MKARIAFLMIAGLLLALLGTAFFADTRAHHRASKPGIGVSILSRASDSTSTLKREKPRRHTQTIGSRYVAAIEAIQTEKPLEAFADAALAQAQYRREKERSLRRGMAVNRKEAIQNLSGAYALLLDLEERHFGRIPEVSGRLKNARSELISLIDQEESEQAAP